MHKWSFRTIVNQTIRSHIYNERSKQATRIQTVSLDAEIPGTDGLTYGDMITSENIRYMDEKEKYAMEVKFDVKIPEAAKMRASKAGSMRNWKKNNNRHDFNVYRLGETIYIEKLAKNRKNKED